MMFRCSIKSGDADAKRLARKFHVAEVAGGRVYFDCPGAAIDGNMRLDVLFDLERSIATLLGWRPDVAVHGQAPVRKMEA